MLGAVDIEKHRIRFYAMSELKFKRGCRCVSGLILTLHLKSYNGGTAKLFECHKR